MEIRTLVKVCRRKHTRKRVVLAHLLENLDKEANLHLSSLLQQGVESSSALGLTENTEPLLNSCQLILEVLVKGGGSHLLQRSLILVDIGNPLLGKLVLRINIGIALALIRLCLTVEVGGRANAACSSLACHRGDIGRRTEIVVVANR